ncbi:hypothetical protein L3i23_28150 [Herbiconiux sp. L3-i23]|nr:hypothetical protein L3i23_28150 [Herbiconiux sp. L3-i23]
MTTYKWPDGTDATRMAGCRAFTGKGLHGVGKDRTGAGRGPMRSLTATSVGEMRAMGAPVGENIALLASKSP